MTDTNPELENQSMGSESSSQDQDSISRQGTEPKKKLKNLRSHKLSKPSTRRAKSQSDHPPVDTSKADFQASSPDSESSINSKEQRRKNLNTSKSNSSSPGLKSARILTRTTSLKPVRILSKIRKASKVSPIPMSSAERATCSSTIKGSKIPDSVEHEHEHEHGESDSKILPVMKVCPYTYCSLHGHRHAPAVPLKQYMSKKRRSMKGQKSTKSKSLSPLEGKHSRDVKEGIHENQRVSTGNSENQKTASNNHGGITSKGKNIEMDGLTGATGGLSDTCKTTTSDAPVESLALKSVLSSDSVDDTLEGQIAANEEKNEDSKPDGRCLQGLPPLEDSDPNCTSDALQETQMEKRKYIRMWHLIHQSVVSSTATKSGTPLHVNGAGAEQVGNANTLLWGKSYDSYQGFSKTSQDMDMEGNDEGRQKMELCQIDAVKLVQEAIDGILLPETGDYSSDDKSINGDIDSEQGPLERNRAEGGDRSIFTPTDSAKDSRSSPDIIWPRADGIITQDEENTVPKVESKFNQRTPSKWSNLKKLILFKRFIKALEKVSTFSPREPRYLPLEPDPKAEKISLRHQSAEERKSAEEWMLDYALRQVVAKLTPARKKRVQMIVQAFETVIPLSENGTNPGLNASVSTHTNPITDSIGSAVQNGEGTGKDKLAETLVGKTPYPETSPVMSELKEASPECWRAKTDVDKPIAQAFDKDGKEEEIDEAILGNGEVKSPLTGQLSAITKSTSQDVEGSTAINSLALSASVCREGQFATSKENTIDSEPDKGLPQTSPQPEDTEPDNDSHVAYKTQMEKQKYMKMWHVIYHHVVSGRAAKVGSQLHLNGANKEEQVDDANTLHGDISGSCQDLSETDKDMVQKSHNAENQKMEISQIDAIKLVEEAIDEVLLPENQDQSSDDQSIASDVTSEQDISETNHDEDVELKISMSSADTIKEFKKINVEKGKVFDSEEKGLKVGDITRLQQEKTEPEVGIKPNQHMSKRWSNLKKVILLKRFIKALDKVKKFNPRKPQYLPLEPDPEAERIDLKHQTLEERKSAEEWMLDYALQQVVTKLTPARKRRVELLVEAFQTVVPQSGIETHLQHNSAISPHRKPIQARDWLLR